MEFSRPEHWGSLSLLQGIFPTQETPKLDLPNPGDPSLGSPALQVDSLPAELPGKANCCIFSKNPNHSCSMY